MAGELIPTVSTASAMSTVILTLAPFSMHGSCQRNATYMALGHSLSAALNPWQA